VRIHAALLSRITANPVSLTCRETLLPEKLYVRIHTVPSFRFLSKRFTSFFGMSGSASDARVSCAMSGHGILPASCNLWVCRSCRVYHFENPFSVTAQALQGYHQSTTRPSEYDASVALHSRHSDPLNDDDSDDSG
jgi:hypothetical protein